MNAIATKTLAISLIVMIGAVGCAAGETQPGTSASAPTALGPQMPGCLAPTSFDADGDGIDNQTEVTRFGTDPDNCDTDGDGRPDSEVFGGYDPLTPEVMHRGPGTADGTQVAAPDGSHHKFTF